MTRLSQQFAVQYIDLTGPPSDDWIVFVDDYSKDEACVPCSRIPDLLTEAAVVAVVAPADRAVMAIEGERFMAGEPGTVILDGAALANLPAALRRFQEASQRKTRPDVEIREFASGADLLAALFPGVEPTAGFEPEG